MGAGGGAADAREQPAPRRRRAPARTSSSTAASARRRATRPACGRSSASSCASGDDETLLVQSGKPVAVFETHEQAPRVLIANSNLVPQWATWEHFRELDAAGLMMYGQMTAGSWIYIGTQGILQGTYETFAAVAAQALRRHARAAGSSSTAGLGGMGGAQPLAVTMNEGCALCVEVDLHRIERRLQTRYLDERAADLDAALERLEAARAAGEAVSVGLLGNAAEVLPELVRRGVDGRRRHRPDERPRPAQRLRPRRADGRAGRGPAPQRPGRLPAPGRRVGAHARRPRSATCRRAGAEAFDYGNALRGLAQSYGDEDAFAYPGLRPRLHPPAVLRGQGPVPLGGAVRRPGRHPRHRRGDPRPVRRPGAHRRAGSPSPRSASPSRACRRGSAGWATASATSPACAFNEMVASGELRAPIVIGRDHLDAGSVASPERETEAMADGTDAVADWPLLNALVNTACGASWVSIHHGGGVGMGKSIHAGQVVRRRRHAARGRAHPPRAHRRPRHGHRPPRRRRRARGARRRRADGRPHADARPCSTAA